MVRKFECADCKTRFEADDKEYVVCPHCKSDNVDYAVFHMPLIVWKIGVAIAIILVVALVVLSIDWGNADEQTATETGDSRVDSTEVIVVPGLDVPPTIEVGDLTFEEDHGYTFTAIVNNRPAGKTYVAVINPLNNQVVSKSDKGEFKDIPYSEADGAFYTIALMDASNDSILTSMEKPGFIKQIKPSKKMSQDELQAKINSRDDSLLGLGENDYLSPDLKLQFIGLPEDAVNVPTILSEVLEKLDMEVWSSVSVSDLKYDDMNRIAVIVLKVNQ